MNSKTELVNPTISLDSKHRPLHPVFFMMVCVLLLAFGAEILLFANNILMFEENSMAVLSLPGGY